MTSDHYISQVVSGHSFLDIGPLWVTENEKLSVARHHGAVRVGALDQIGFHDPMWDKLDARLKATGTPYERYSMDVCQYNSDPWDVLYCAGVLYHHPSPVVLLRKLHAITTNHLILSAVVAVQVAGYPLVPGSMVFLPAVPQEWMAVLREEWRPFIGDGAGDIFDHEVQWDINNLYHWWWLFSEDAVIGMCRAVGFRVVSAHTEGHILTLLLERPHT